MSKVREDIRRVMRKTYGRDIYPFEEIRADATLCPIPVIALTARVMSGDREEILARGFDGYLSKPIDAELFHQTIQEALDGN